MEKFCLPFGADSEELVDNPSVIDKGLPGTAVDGHGVAEMRNQQLVDRMSVREVAQGAHGIGLHGGMAGLVVGRELMMLQ